MEVYFAVEEYDELLNGAINLGKLAVRIKARKEERKHLEAIKRYNGFQVLDYQYLFGVMAEEERLKPPIFQDGTFRDRKYTLEYRFMFDGRQISVYGKTKEICYQKRLELMTGKSTTKSVLTFGQWLKEWHKLYDNKTAGKQNISQNEKYIDSIVEKLGHIPLTKLSGIDIQAYLSTYNAHKNTQHKISLKIKSAVTMAFNLGKIKSNPYVAVSIKKHQPVKHRPLTFKEQNLIYSEISPQYFNLFKFCCLTGLRITEALSIRKKDIDYESGLIYAKRLKKRGKEVISPVPFLPKLLDFKFKDKLFAELTYNGFKCYLQDFYKKINIKGVMIHNFRSTFASLCYAAGIPSKHIQEWLCHETLAMTMDTYTHLIKSGTSPLFEYIKSLKEHLKI